MNNSLLYAIWSVIPLFILFFYLKNKITEVFKPSDKRIIRSKYYKQIFIFILACILAAYLINEHLLPIIFIDYKLLTAAKCALLPVIIAVLAPYAGANKAPETMHDKLRKRGYREMKKSE